MFDRNPTLGGLSSDPPPQSKATDCLTVVTRRESVISVIENSQNKHILMNLTARIAQLPDTAMPELGKLIQLNIFRSTPSQILKRIRP